MKSMCGIITVRNTERLMTVKNKNNGFTLIEMLAVILIATTILIPLLSGYINNFEVNTRMHSRKAASSISYSTIEAFDKLNYDTLSELVYDVDPEDGLITLTKDDCDIFEGEETDLEDDEFLPNDDITQQEVCNYIFSLTFADIDFDSQSFQVFLYPYYFSQDTMNAYLDMDIPQLVKDEIQFVMPEDEQEADSIMRISVLIEYDSERESQYVASGVVTRD